MQKCVVAFHFFNTVILQNSLLKALYIFLQIKAKCILYEPEDPT